MVFHCQYVYMPDGTEASGAAGSAVSAAMPRFQPGSESLDAITGVALLERPVDLLVTTGRDGVVRVWR